MKPPATPPVSVFTAEKLGTERPERERESLPQRKGKDGVRCPVYVVSEGTYTFDFDNAEQTIRIVTLNLATELFTVAEAQFILNDLIRHVVNGGSNE